MVNNLVFRWPKPLFFMVLGAHGIQYLKSRWHSSYILVYKDPLLITNLPFGICAIYFDLKVNGL